MADAAQQRRDFQRAAVPVRASAASPAPRNPRVGAITRWTPIRSRKDAEYAQHHRDAAIQ